VDVSARVSGDSTEVADCGGYCVCRCRRRYSAGKRGYSILLSNRTDLDYQDRGRDRPFQKRAPMAGLAGRTYFIKVGSQTEQFPSVRMSESQTDWAYCLDVDSARSEANARGE
jgi:hypothetical protein